MFGDNQSVVTSATIPHLTLGKRWNALSYHRVREAIAAGWLRFEHISGIQNPADILTNALSWSTLRVFVEPMPVDNDDNDVVDRSASIWRRFGGEFVRYPCPVCQAKSVFININSYGPLNMPRMPDELMLDDDNMLQHRDTYPIPSKRVGAHKKLDGEKAREMRRHFSEKHPGIPMPTAFAKKSIGMPIPIGANKAKVKNDRAKAARAARAKRKAEGTMTPEDEAYYKSRRQQARHQQTA
jgi:hypothetical protein